MGGAVSSGQNNDDLIDKLLEADYIKTSLIERVFRAVDRAEYFLPEARADAYKDLAWKSGNLHLSAPCIYSEVMEGLCLRPGLSFLNLGSGTGYLSTMVGLILGISGINHGVELHEDVIQYANRKLEEFKKYSGAIDEYDFCQPKFVQGNCLCLTSDRTALYDRIYCGAACPDEYESYMKNLLKVGGILVMPINDELLQIKRVTETEWTRRCLLPVSFAYLIVPSANNQEWVDLIEVEPLPLQFLCRAVVRNILRKNVEFEHPPVSRPPPVKAPKKKRVLRHLVIPIFDSDSDDSSEEEHRQVRLGGERNRDAGRATFRARAVSFFRPVDGARAAAHPPARGRSATPSDRRSAPRDEPMETDSSAEEAPPTGDGRNAEPPNLHQVKAVIEHVPEEMGDAPPQPPEEPPLPPSIDNISDVIVECLNVLRRARRTWDSSSEDDDHNEETANEPQEEDGEKNKEDNSKDEKPGTSKDKKNGKREKFDSGLGDEIIETQESDQEQRRKLDDISSCSELGSEEPTEKKSKRIVGSKRYTRRTNREQDSSSSDEDDVKQTYNTERRVYKSPFTEHMVSKIQQLPLPPILKRYLNFFREL